MLPQCRYSARIRRLRLLVAAFAALMLSCTSSALAGNWLPHSSDATWTYTWTDSVYNTTPTKEKVTVQDSKGPAFTLAWTTDGLDNPAGAPTSIGTVLDRKSVV